MKITEQEVRYVADLANLTLTDQEVARMRADLDEILGHVDKLNELDTAGVAPMAQVLYGTAGNSTLREDIPREPLGQNIALANAPKPGGGCFKVPLVIER